MKYSCILASVLAIGLLSGCGSKLSKLTNEEKATVKATTNSAQRAYKTSSPKNNGLKRELLKNGESDSFFIMPNAMIAKDSGSGPKPVAVGPSTSAPSSDQKLIDLQNRLSDGVQDGSCKYSDSGMNNRSFMPTPKKYKVSLTGEKCPLTFQCKLETKDNEFKFNLDFKVQDKEMKELTEMNSFKADGKFKIEEKSASMKMDSTLSMVKYGEVKVEMKGDASGNDDSGKGNLTITMNYEKFTAEFEITMKAEKGKDPTVKYYLNNEELTKEEMQEYISQLPGAY